MAKIFQSDGARELKYFVMTTGRAGSSLLMNIIGASGGNIGQPALDEWDIRLGAHENSVLNDAQLYWDYSEKLRPMCYLSHPHMWLRKFLRSVAKKKFKRAVKTANFHKSGSAGMPMLAGKFGYRPRVIALYRHYASYMQSAYQRHGDSVEKLADYYINNNASILFLVDLYGGCAISFEELTDLNETAWAAALAGVTGLDQNVLLAKREGMLKKNRLSVPERLDMFPDFLVQRLESVLAALKRQKGKIFEGGI